MQSIEFNLIRFVKLNKSNNDYPIASSNVYLPENNFKQLNSSLLNDNVNNIKIFINLNLISYFKKEL